MTPHWVDLFVNFLVTDMHCKNLFHLNLYMGWWKIQVSTPNPCFNSDRTPLLTLSLSMATDLCLLIFSHETGHYQLYFHRLNFLFGVIQKEGLAGKLPAKHTFHCHIPKDLHYCYNQVQKNGSVDAVQSEESLISEHLKRRRNR